MSTHTQIDSKEPVAGAAAAVAAALGLMTPAFDLGRILATSAAIAELSTAESMSDVQSDLTADFNAMLARHQAADFGDLCDEDVRTQKNALAAETRDPKRAERMMSVYTVRGVKLWVITEWDRSVTTILLPEDY